jgi:hypothetical protein
MKANQLTPFVSSISVFLFFLLDDMIPNQIFKYTWYLLISIAVCLDGALLVYSKEGKSISRLMVSGLGIASILFYLLRNILFQYTISGSPSLNSIIEKSRELILVLIVLSSFGALVLAILARLGDSKIRVSSTLSQKKENLLLSTISGFFTILPILILINYIAYKRNYNFDLSLSNKNSLSNISKDIIKNIQGPIKIYAFYPRPLESDGPENSLALNRVRPDVEIFLDQVKAVNPAISVEFVNADVEIDRVSEIGGSRSNGTILFQKPNGLDKSPEQTIFIRTPTDLEELERKSVASLMTIATKSRKFYYPTMNGERFSSVYSMIPNEQITKLKDSLTFMNIILNEWSISNGFPLAIPSDADGIILLGPTTSYPVELQNSVMAFSNLPEKSILIFSDPSSQETFQWVLNPLGYQLKNVRLEQEKNQTVIITNQFPSHPSTESIPEKSVGVVMPNSGGLERINSEESQFEATPILESGDQVFDPKNKDKKQNYILGIIGVHKTNPTTRILFYSSVSFVSDQYIKYNLNPALVSSTISYLFQDTVITDIPPKKNEMNTFTLSDNQKLIVWVLGMFLFPGLVTIVSYMIATQKKSKKAVA